MCVVMSKYAWQKKYNDDENQCDRQTVLMEC